MQMQVGGLNGTVGTNDGGPLAGVTVTTSGAGTPQVQTTGPWGQFSFRDLVAGTYAVTAQMPGFVTTEVSGLQIGMGRTVQIEIKMQMDGGG